MAGRDQLLQQRTWPIFRVSELVVKDLHHREQHIVSSDPEHNQFISAQRSPSVDVRRVEMSLARIREWMRANPQSAEEVLRQNRSFVFFRIVGLSDDREPKDARDASHDREAVGAQGVPLTPGRSIAVDNALQGPSHLQNWTSFDLDHFDLDQCGNHSSPHLQHTKVCPVYAARHHRSGQSLWHPLPKMRKAHSSGA
jgi:MltA specific insert domain